MASDDGRAQEGIALLERARDKNPRAVQPRLILANYQLRRGNAGEALVLAREAFAIAAQLPAAALLLGRAQIASGMADDAVSTLSELAERRWAACRRAFWPRPAPCRTRDSENA